MRYAFDNGLKSLIDYKKIKIAMRQNSFHDLLEWELGKKMPMPFGSLDHISNNTISKLKTSGNISVESLYKIFDNDDIRLGRCESLIPYKNYISGLDEHTENRIKFNVDDKLFFSNLEPFIKKLKLIENANAMNVKFRSRSDVYSYIESINNNELYNNLELKSTVKALADLIYILDKAEFLQEYVLENNIKTVIYYLIKTITIPLKSI